MALKSCSILVEEEEKDPKRIAAAKKAWETIRANQKEKQMIK